MRRFLQTRRLSIWVAACLPMALLIGAGVLMVWSAQTSKQAEMQVRLGLRVLSQIHALHAQLAEGASGIRGFLLTQKDSFLAPYELARVRIPPALEALSGKVKDSEQQRHLAVVTTLINEKLTNLAVIKAQATTADRDATLQIILNDNKNLLDRLRATVVLMERREEIVIAERSAIADRWRQQALVLSLVALLMVLVGMAFSAWLALRARQADAAAAAAEQTNRAKSDMLSRVSHELRTPLNGILGYAQLLARQPLAPLAQRQVGHILASGDHLLQLVNDVLDLSRHELRAPQLSLRALPLAALLHDCMAWVESTAHSTAAWHTQLDDTLSVYADEQRLRQILINLLSNAMKFNRPGGALSVAIEAIDATVVVRISDSGEGIASTDLERLFQPFERLHKGIEGIGLGLTISRQLAQAMGGDIHVASELGTGSTFTLVLPRVEPT